jgi:hypothetical protein
LLRFVAGALSQFASPKQADAVSNLTYTLGHRDRLSGAAWARLVDLSARRTNRVETITHTNPAALGFCCVVTPRQP